MTSALPRLTDAEIGRLIGYGVPTTAPPPGQARLIDYRVRQREYIGAARTPETALITILHGTKELDGPGGTVAFPAGSLMLLPAGWSGPVVNSPPDDRPLPYRALVLVFPAGLIRRALKAHPRPPIPTNRPPVSGYGVAARPALVSALLHAVAGLTQPTEINHSLCEHRVMEVLLALIDSGAAGLRPQLAPSLVEAVRRLVRLTPERDWTAAALADELGFSRATFNRRLKAAGVSAQGLITEERMRIAQSLLHDDGISLHDAAAACGYANTARFIRRFRAVTGQHPRAFSH